MKATIRLIQALLAMVWLALLAGAVLLYVDGTVAGNHPPQIGEWACWTAVDSSMAPEIEKGDLVLVRMGAAAQPGDPVLCRKEEGEGGLALCRIIGTSEGQLILKGDGAEDGFLASPSAVEGVCAAYLPGFGAAAEFLRSLPGIAVIAAAGILLILLGIVPRGGKSPGRRTARPAEPASHPGRDRYIPRH